VKLDGFVYDLARARARAIRTPERYRAHSASLEQDLARVTSTVNAIALGVLGPPAVC